MRFAIVEGEKCEPKTGLRGICPCCGSEMIAKCGKKVVHHWAHKSKLDCDRWWENETLWHRGWKDEFPKEFQEVICFDGSGEKHIADIKIPNGLVIEFQNSKITRVEVIKRNSFYKNIIWIVNGLTQRKNDYSDFCFLLKRSKKINNYPPTYYVKIEDSKILVEWGGLQVPVLFDFLEEDLSFGKTLWMLIPSSKRSKSVLIQINFPLLKSIVSLNLSKLILNLTKLNEELEDYLDRSEIFKQKELMNKGFRNVRMQTNAYSSL